jgi:predicted nucleic acid-binding protein
MRADIVVDASVAAKFYFHEEGSDRARTLLTSGVVVAAPDLLFLEMASLAATHVRRGLASLDLGRDAVGSLGDLIDDVTPSSSLAVRAFMLARDSGISAYDGAYVALAERLSVPVVTADRRLIERAQLTGLGSLVRRF